MSNGLAVIHTIGSLWRSSGVTDAVVYAANGCACAGQVATVITWANAASVSPSVFAPSVDIVLLNRPRGVIRRLVLFRKILHDRVHAMKRCGHSVVIHDHGLWLESNIAAAWIAATERVPLIVSPHGMLEPWALSYRARKKRLAWWTYQRAILHKARLIHVTASAEEASVAALLPQTNRRIVPLGTQASSTVSACTSKTAVFLSRLHCKKGIDLLIEAWAKAVAMDWELLIVGPDEGGYAQVVNDRIQALGISDRVRLLGPLYGEDKERILANSALFVLPSRSENFGLVVAEALMAGLPVITTNTTPWLDLDKRGCGWTISPNVDELADCLSEATQLSAERLRSMGQAGRAWMLADFTWDRYGRRMASLYEEAID